MLKIKHSIENSNTGHAKAKPTEPYIIFTVNNEEFGVESLKVLEIVSYLAPLKMPNNYGNAQGVATYRGKIIPIIDLRMIFGLDPISYGDNTVTIVVESGCVFGVTAEQVLDLVFIPVTSIKKVSAFNFGEKTKYLKSVANFGERLVLLLDPDKMVEIQAKPELIVETGLVEERGLMEYPQTSQGTGSSAAEYRIDPKELEDLLQKTPKPRQEEKASLANEIEAEVAQATIEENLVMDSENSMEGILEAEQITEILSGLESDLTVELPEDSLPMKTTAEIANDSNQTEARLSDEVIEALIIELEAESEPDSDKPSSGKDGPNVKANQFETPKEKWDV
jgi:purine-binding chemotaxis protein CheW